MFALCFRCVAISVSFIINFPCRLGTWYSGVCLFASKDFLGLALAIESMYVYIASKQHIHVHLPLSNAHMKV